ncbi:MAG: hypothetical protein Q9227_009306 [Pyrenula ochraceoflavens]
MAAGLGEAASVISFISLSVQLVDGCVKGFVLLSKAQGLGSKASIIQCQLQWEEYLFKEWASTVGLFQQPPELNVPLSSAPVIRATLQNLLQLLTDTERIKANYGLSIEVTDEEIKEVQAPRNFLGRALDHYKPQIVNDTAKVFSRRNGIWKKFKWAAFDAQTLEVLVKDIKYFNTKLHGLLDTARRNACSWSSKDLMRNVISNSPENELQNFISGHLLSLDNAIEASAKLRQKGFLTNLTDPSNEVFAENTSTRTSRTSTLLVKSPRKRSITPSGSMSALRLDPRLLTLSSRGRLERMAREIGWYNDAPVVVEWKDVEMSLESKLKHRILDVAGLLSEMDEPSFHSLKCIGFVKPSKSGQYAYLFEPPLLAGHCAEPSMKSLSELLHMKNPRPSLTKRLHISSVLAETVLQLHTAGWLHKDISSENVIFFHSAEHDWGTSSDLASAFLGGYGFARRDSTLEMTEDPSAARYAALYRHADAQGSGRKQFNKNFDLFSLGCILLEVGLWHPLESILLHQSRSLPLDGKDVLHVERESDLLDALRCRKSIFEGPGQGTIARDLAFATGTKYVDMVRGLFLAAAPGRDQGDDEFEVDDLKTQIEVFEALRTLADASR